MCFLEGIGVSIQLSAISYQIEGNISRQEEFKVPHEKDYQRNLAIYCLHATLLRCMT